MAKRFHPRMAAAGCVSAALISAWSIGCSMPVEGSANQSTSALGDYDASLGNRVADMAARVDGRASGNMCLKGVGDALDAAGIQPTFPRLPAAVNFDDWARGNPGELAARGYQQQDRSIDDLPRGTIITWRPGQCGYHSQYGHIEIVISQTRACSDYCGTIKQGCGSPGIFVPVGDGGGSSGGTCPGGTGRTIGAIDAKYRELGGCGSVLGAPLTDETTTPDGIGRYNVFERGSIYWTEKTGAHEVHGEIRDKWKEIGWETAEGPMGYPITDETTTPDGIGRYNVFERGSIYWSPKTGANEVYGYIRDTYKEIGWEAGPLGYPISGEYDVENGRKSDFEHGSITWDKKANEMIIVIKGQGTTHTPVNEVPSSDENSSGGESAN